MMNRSHGEGARSRRWERRRELLQPRNHLVNICKQEILLGSWESVGISGGYGGSLLEELDFTEFE